jgi:hypothetical protein
VDYWSGVGGGVVSGNRASPVTDVPASSPETDELGATPASLTGTDGAVGVVGDVGVTGPVGLVGFVGCIGAPGCGVG